MFTYKIILYKSKKLANGDHPVMVQVVHNRKVNRISTEFSGTLKQWNLTDGRFKTNIKKGLKKNAKQINKYFQELEAKLDTIKADMVKSGIPYSITILRSKLFRQNSNKTVWEVFDELMLEMQEQDRTGNYRAYRDARNAIKRYNGDPKLTLYDIDYKFLTKLEQFLRKGGASSGIRVYMESLRAVFNESIRRGYVEAKVYPFYSQTNFSTNGKYKIGKLKAEYNPRALSQKDMDKFKQYDPGNNAKLARAHRYALFIYYSRGMNFVDMAHLNREDLYDGRITYKRKKSKGLISVKLTDNLLILLSYFDSESEYVFPILDESKHKTAQQQADRVKKVRKRLNKELKEIGKALKIKLNLTTYTFRHTYAQTLKDKGISATIISENMGHSTLDVTRHYLKKLSGTSADEADKVL